MERGLNGVRLVMPFIGGMDMIPVISVVGKSNVGKTTFLLTAENGHDYPGGSRKLSMHLHVYFFPCATRMAIKEKF
jgi:hypothetical protein